jgi:phosphotransferase system enzyme I (PtsI)
MHELTVGAATAWLRGWAAAIGENEQHLTALDAAIGDADHGANLRRGVAAVIAQLDAHPPSTVAEALTLAGEALVGTVGGASGPLFGTLLLRAAAAAATDRPALDGPGLAAALRAGTDGVRERGRAEPGDKTMLDALLPAIDAFDGALASGQPLDRAVRIAADAARAARDATARMVAKRGRASQLGDRSLGAIDPGSASAALLLDALAAALGAEATPTPTAPSGAAPPSTAPIAPRVGIVLVSHSYALAQAARLLADEVVGEHPPRIALAAGRADGGTGTNATRVAAAISEASQGRGVVVITDLGSAVLSADMALEQLGGRIPVRVVAAPFVEGLLAATVRAAAGDELDTVAAEAEAALAPKRALLRYDDVPGPGDGPIAAPRAATARPASGDAAAGVVTATATVVNEGGLHARPAAEIAALAARFTAELTIAVEGKPLASARSPLAIAVLAAGPGTLVQLSAEGADARPAIDALIALLRTGFGEPLVAAATEGATPSAPALSAPALPAATVPAAARTTASETAAPVPVAPDAAEPGSGALGVSPGRVIGPVAVLVHAIAEPSATAVLAPPARAAAAGILRDALEATGLDYRRRAAATSGHRAEVLAATAAIAADPALAEGATAAIRARGLTPERAIWETIGATAEQYRSSGGTLVDRITDLHDVRDRVIARLTGVEAPGLPERREPYVLVADDLAPADTVTLDPATCLALVTEGGGPTSHTAIIARELGLPAVVGVAGATGIPDGTLVLVDGSTGEVIVQPDPVVQATATGVIRVPPFRGPGQTADGHRVVLSANVGAPREIARAVERGAEGVGLFRTEFCFLDRADEPSVAEQVAAYREVFAAFPAQRVIVRTLDAGSDKPLPFFTPIHEPNPVLGLRGVRTAIRDPLVLERQLRAIAEAAAVERADVAVMAPMIATLGETREFAARAREAGIRSIGVMLETPAAALTATELCGVVDFLSVGTNDLSQYTMAADRMSAALAPLADPWQPALLRIIRIVGEAAAATGTPVGLCGEAAADPDFAAVLVGLGASSLSMVARAIPTVGARLAGVTLAQCRAAAAAACAAPDPVAARDAARAALR